MRQLRILKSLLSELLEMRQRILDLRPDVSHRDTRLIAQKTSLPPSIGGEYRTPR